MTEQSFGYYQHPSSFDPFSGLQYNQPPYDTGYIGNDSNPFADPNFKRAMIQYPRAFELIRAAATATSTNITCRRPPRISVRR
ncbi:hypothetical protein RSOLAG1IB_00532 [Rhizoctonia solani AG-1 IB]|uniref:Uncharacterized protein n=1 Tax=Thanatephorus cucumeris (strain AG1-IB / isolate 7/3/14) TaxID=1108050 RepID=A0A0B7F393_THACB|nr:hypothetical protein RSOLAG1IB_00532 [Rhizoctonia solani AG-1 IB]